jgi:hypothetical protein
MRLSKLSPDEKKKLQEYISSLKEIKKEIHTLLEKAGVNYKNSIEEEGGNRSTGLYLNVNEED